MTALLPPSDPEAEAAVIAAVLSQADAIDVVGDWVRPEDLFSMPYSEILAAALRVDAAGESVDLVSVAGALRDAGKLQVAGWPESVRSALESPVVSGLETHCRRVSQLARVRRLLDASARITAEGHGALEDLDQWCQRAEQLVFEAAEGVRPVGGAKPLSELLPEVSAEISGRNQHDDTVSGYVRVPWIYLRRKVHGLSRCKVHVVAGRPGMGKSVFTQELCRQCGESSLYVSLEMTAEEITQRLLAAESGVNSETIMHGFPDHNHWQLMTEAMTALVTRNISIVYRPGCTVQQVRSLVRREKARLARAGLPPLHLVVVDYLQLMGSTRRKGDTRETEVAELSKGLLTVAGEQDVAMVTVSQLNRGVDARPNKRPMMSDLRESGAIEQDAHSIMMLYRDEYYYRDSTEVGVLEVDVAKNRNGTTGAVKLEFVGEFCRVIEPTDGYEDFDA